MARLVKRSFALSGHRTSVALEPEFWAVLDRMAQHAGQTLAALVAAIDATRHPSDALASRLRLAALGFALSNLAIPHRIGPESTDPRSA